MNPSGDTPKMKPKLNPDSRGSNPNPDPKSTTPPPTQEPKHKPKHQTTQTLSPNDPIKISEDRKHDKKTSETNTRNSLKTQK